MLHLFIMHPSWYFVPALITLVAMTLIVKLKEDLLNINLPNDQTMHMSLRGAPGLIVLLSMLWFIVVPFFALFKLLNFFNWLFGKIVR